MNFLWKNKKSFVKQKTIISNVSDGGLKMIHFPSMVASLKIMWIKRILFNCNAKWMNLFLYMSNINKEDLTHKFKVNYLTNTNSRFSNQILQYWYSLYSVEPSDVPQILSERLWDNSFITIDNKPVPSSYISGLKINQVKELYNFNILMNRDQLLDKYSINISIMKYNSLVAAIPKHWRQAIEKSEPCIPHHREATHLECIQKDIQTICNKDIYEYLVKCIV